MSYLTDLATRRYSTKVFDASKTISQEKIDELKVFLQLTPSAINLQPWHFMIAASRESKNRIAQSAIGDNVYNVPKLKDASHVFVLCSRSNIDESYLTALTEQEKLDGRFPNLETEQMVHAMRSRAVAMHQEMNNLDRWVDGQIYIALGNLLVGANLLEIDACTIGGFDRKELDRLLGLSEKGLRPVMLVALGYRAKDDFNAATPKSRFTAENIFSELD